MPILQIKSQGFPQLIEDLGVQSPLTGPFWGFEPTVIPTFQIGASPLVTPLGGLPYLPADFIDNQITDPGASAALIQTANLPAGNYMFQFNGTWINGSASGGAFLYKIRNIGGTVLRSTPIAAMGLNTNPGSVGQVEVRFCEQLNEGDNILVENLFALVPGDVRGALRWVRIGSTNFSF